ncbi:MAG: DUF3536 domain-containing protein [Ignavibacteriae bacterium]|nr:DUF3536 domain-containing protein [Ignavibacteriota bacterium]
MKEKFYLCIHGHFYQPPRENPWTGEIELQPSAAPFHDWNERIFCECYKPNTEAEILDLSSNKVVERINNYQYLSFNFGPTLLHWMGEKHPDTLQKIIDADRASIKNHKGHGNSIAQVYNHIILPLASEQDCITQIKWGLYDFEFHFRRKSEGIWLAETACNNKTIEYLIDEGIKYVILDPSQALCVRNINSDNWQDVSNGRINTKHPYRIFSKKDSQKYTDVFFYDGALSRAIAFEDIVFSAEKLMNRINSLTTPDEKPRLISIAVDGETFGHHKHFADRTIAYLLSKLIPASGIKLVNFGEYLEMFPPEYEVKLNEGINKEGTSWSCVHGVGRWYRNCGCHTGAEPGWNQEWRTPLRNSLNTLRDRLKAIYEAEGGKYFKNVWQARNEYIKIILDSSENARADFLKRNSEHYLNPYETMTALKLLEIQKLSMLMFTSCGWFFSDISGIETIQILAYAKKAVEMANDIFGIDFEPELLEGLAKAISNKPEYKNGAEIYNTINFENGK